MAFLRSPWTWLWALVCTVLVGYVIYPSLTVVFQSITDPDGAWTLDAERAFFGAATLTNLSALINSIMLSAASVVLSAIIGVPLAWLLTAMEFRGRRFCSSLVMTPIVLPPLVGVLAFLFLYGESGFLPRGIQILLGLETSPFGADGAWAILLVHGYTMYVFFYVFSAAALDNLDPTLLEAAKSLGAGWWMAARRVVLPVLGPALVGASLLVFMTSMASFSAPLIFGGGFRVLSVLIYDTKLAGDLQLAAMQTVILSVVSLVFLIVMRWYFRHRRQGGAGKGVGSSRTELNGRAARLLIPPVAVGLMVLMILPHLTVILLSFVKNGTWTYQLLPPSYTLENYYNLFASTNVAKPIINSLKMASIATAGNLVFGVVIAAILTRGPVRGRVVLDLLVMLPWALPGTVVAVNLISAYSEPNIFSAGHVLVGTFWLLPIAYFIRHLPLVVRSAHAALQQFDPALEEAARSLSAGWWLRMRKIVFPVVAPGVFAGGLLAFVTALGEFVSSVMLWIPSNRPISVAIFSELDEFNLGTAAAYGVLLILLIGAALLGSQRFLGLKTRGVIG